MNTESYTCNIRSIARLISSAVVDSRTPTTYRMGSDGPQFRGYQGLVLVINISLALLVRIFWIALK